MEWTPLPIGVDNFEKLRDRGYYYVDKTLFIKDLIDMHGEVNLFTRPRRFGKTLNMSMLRYFYEISDEDRSRLFAGTKIMDAGEKYIEEMGQYPVISLSLKSMKQASYKSAFYCLKEDISREFNRHRNLSEGIETEEIRLKYHRFAAGTAEDDEYLTALKFLSECLYSFYGRKAVILIDEYGKMRISTAFMTGWWC